MKKTQNIEKIDKYHINIDVKKKYTITGSIYIIKVPVYRCSIFIMFDKETFELEKQWDKDTNYDGKTINYLDKHREILITFPDKNPKLAVVVHELLHACQMIMYSCGHRTDTTDADEPIAYLLSYLFEQYAIIKNIKI